MKKTKPSKPQALGLQGLCRFNRVAALTTCRLIYTAEKTKSPAIARLQYINFAKRNFARQGKASKRNEAVVTYGDLSASML